MQKEQSMLPRTAQDRPAGGRQETGRWGMPVKACLAASAAVVALFAASEVSETITGMNEDGFAQSLRQSAWTRALSDQSAGESWPWQTVASPMSHLPSAKVQRLGLSASLLEATERTPELEAARLAKAPLESAQRSPRSAEGDIALGDVGSGTVSIGDSITFTANDGATCVYRVSGRPVVDPHLDSGQAEGAQGVAGLFDCSPLDGLFLRATQEAQQKAQKAVAPEGHAGEHQRKL